MDEGSSDKIASFAKEMNVNYTVLRTTDEVSDLYGGIDGLPTTFYVGRDGVVIEQAAGLVSKDVIENEIKAALARGANGVAVSRQPEPATAADGKTKQ